MEPTTVRNKILGRIRHMAKSAIIKNRRFLDDEQLIRSEQLAVLEQIFNANVRDAEIQELSSHFAGILRGDHPCHLAIWGKTGTGKTLTLSFFLNLLAEMARDKNVPIRHEQLDLSTPRPCFRALNDLACLLGASKRYKKGISLEELMLRIEAKLADYRGYLILFIDEVDNVQRDRDTFLTFLVRRLPQRINAKLVLVFASNRLNWPDHLDPRVKSFLKLNELIFKPYDAVDLQHILRIRVEKALSPDSVDRGVIEKIAAMASQDHGDARRAVALLAKSAYVAEKAGSRITLDLVDSAATELDRDRYLALLRSAPTQLQAAMAAVIEATRRSKGTPIGTGETYDAYKRFCRGAGLRGMLGGAPDEPRARGLEEMDRPASIELTLEREGAPAATCSFAQPTGTQIIGDIEPGDYRLKTDTGRVLWQGELTPHDVLWANAFPGLDLPLAAETKETVRQPTREIDLLDGLLVLRVYPGIEAGTLEIVLKMPQASA